MFIYESFQLGKKYDFYLDDTEMIKIFKDLSKDNAGLVIIQKNLHSLYNDKWLSLSKEFNKPIFFSIIVNCYSPLSEKKEPFLFIARNLKEYNLLKRISIFFENQHFSLLSEIAISFFKRIHVPVFVIKKTSMISLLDGETINLTPFSPSTNQYTLTSREIVQTVNFGTVHENIDRTFNQWVNKHLPYIDWDEHEDGNSKINIAHLISLNGLNPDEVLRIKKELQWLESKKTTSLFFICTLLKEEFDIKFDNSFHHFLLSYALGLIDKSDVSKNKDNTFSDVFLQDFKLNIEDSKKTLLTETIRSLLDSINFQMKYPLHYRNIPLSTTINLQHPTKNLLEISKLAKGMDFLKEVYDSKTKEEQENFAEEMKLYYLFFPEHKSLFQDTFNLNKNTYEKESDLTKLALLPKNKYICVENTLWMDYRAAIRQNIPILHIS